MRRIGGPEGHERPKINNREGMRERGDRIGG